MNPSILIVEDNVSLRKGMLALLRKQGRTVSSAATIADARQQLATVTPTHVILDLNLPDGLGIELLANIRGQGTSVRIMLLTASSDARILAEARQLGVDSIVKKPPDWDKIIQWANS